MSAILKVLVVLALLGALVAGVGLRRCEGTPPQLELPPELVVGRTGRTLELRVTDPDSGWRQLRATLVHARGEVELLSLTAHGAWLLGRPTGPEGDRFELPIQPRNLGLRDEDAVLRVEARDWSWRSWLRGNAARLEVPVTIDLTPPRIGVRNTFTAVRRGGSAMVVYDVNELPALDGVYVGEKFFRGFPLQEGDGAARVALFAIPEDAPPDPPIRVVADDAAGNRSFASWPTRIQNRSFPGETIRLPRSFLETKVRALAEASGLESGDPVTDFQRVNSQLRETNEQRVRELLQGSALPRRLWSGRFEQMSNSKVTSRFAERRVYTVDGVRVSEAVHLGYDLAATAGAPVTAANAGHVVFAGDLGIYGECVLIDHGQGLSSLYGHLSSLAVQAGDEVTKGQPLGRSGQTGLAGGDHLHFAMLVGDVYVDPLEWWDARWVRDHVDALLAPRAE